MIKTENFSKRIGVVKIPQAVHEIPGPDREAVPRRPMPEVKTRQDLEYETFQPAFDPGELQAYPAYKVCLTDLKEGCYTLYYTPKSSGLLGTRYRGTLRVQHDGLQQ